MRLLELEDQNENREADYEEYAYLIKRDCQAYLSQVEDPFSLFKGTIKWPNTFERKTVRLDDRNPLGASPQEHKVYNEVFMKEFGEPFRNSLLVTGDLSHARNFGGTVNIVFPIGNYTFLWSPEVDDINYKIGFGHLRGTDAEIAAKVISYNYQTHDFAGAIDSGHEIMIRSKEYYAMDSRRFYDQQKTTYGETGYDIERLFK